jgi:hypothetical protein
MGRGVMTKAKIQMSNGEEGEAEDWNDGIVE